MHSRTFKAVLLNILIGAVSLSYGFSDWDVYRNVLLAHPNDWYRYLHGGIAAPLQYRVGVWIIVGWMHRWLHLHEWLTLTLVDVCCLAVTIWMILHAVLKSELFQELSSGLQLFSVATLFFLLEYYLSWGHRFQYPSTIPSCLYICLSAFLVSHWRRNNRLWISLLLIGLSFLQGLVRADNAVVLHAGFFLAIWWIPSSGLSAGRLWQAATSVLAAVSAGLVQLYLMLVRFPNARYGTEGVIQVITNLNPLQWITALIGLLPFWLLLWLVMKRKYCPEPVTAMLLVSSLLYIAVWYAVAQLEEIRIFLPFGIALLPATSLALAKFLGTPKQAQTVSYKSI